MCSCLREDEDENDDNNDNDDDDDLCPRVQLGAGSDCSAACPGQAAKSELKKTITMEHICVCICIHYIVCNTYTCDL